MRVLIVKTSSLGDVIHTLPAVTDAADAIPGIRFDWVVEESFAQIPSWHPAVDRILPVALRRWRRHPVGTLFGGEWRSFKKALSQRRYDAIIDAQGLVKSAWLTRYALGPVHGLARDSAREPLASRFYRYRHRIAWEQHAISRVRKLFSTALSYPLAEAQLETPDYGLDRARLPAADVERPYLVFLHGTTWKTKHWPQVYWRALIDLATAAGWRVHLPWGSAQEYARAEQLAQGRKDVAVLPRLDLSGMATQLAHASACVAVDTGLGHLAAAFDAPTVSLFGPTNPGFTGAWGRNQRHLSARFACAPCLRKTCRYRPAAGEYFSMDEQPPCFTTLPPADVWRETETLLSQLKEQE